MNKSKIGYKRLFKEKKFCWYLFSSAITRFGDSVDSLIYAWAVYSITGSAAWLSIVAGVNALPTILFMPFTGVWVERLNKKVVMAVCDIGRGATVAITALLFINGLLNPWLIVLFTLINSTLEAFNGPAASSILPQLLDKELFEYGMGLRNTVSRIMEVLGLAAAPVLSGFLGLGNALLIDSAIFIISGILLMMLKLNPASKDLEKNQKIDFFSSLKESVKYLKERKIILAICLMGCALNALAGPASTLITAFVKEDLHMSESFISLFGISSMCKRQIGMNLQNTKIT